MKSMGLHQFHLKVLMIKMADKTTFQDDRGAESLTNCLHGRPWAWGGVDDRSGHQNFRGIKSVSCRIMNYSLNPKQIEKNVLFIDIYFDF